MLLLLPVSSLMLLLSYLKLHLQFQHSAQFLKLLADQYLVVLPKLPVYIT